MQFHSLFGRNAAATHMVETQQHAAEVERLLKSLGAEIDFPVCDASGAAVGAAAVGAGAGKAPVEDIRIEGTIGSSD